jgi:hypothetical protein
MVKMNADEVRYIRDMCRLQWGKFKSYDRARVSMGVWPLNVSNAFLQASIGAIVSKYLIYHPSVYFAEAISGWWWRVPNNALLYLPSKDVVMWYNSCDGGPAAWHILSPIMEERIEPV